jgi:hypothetical protein
MIMQCLLFLSEINIFYCLLLLSLGLKEDILFLEIVYFFNFAGSSEAAMGAQRPVGRGSEPKKTGAPSARARTRGQNPLVKNIFIFFNILGLIQEMKGKDLATSLYIIIICKFLTLRSANNIF